MIDRFPFDDTFSQSAAAPLPEEMIDIDELLEFVRTTRAAEAEAAAAAIEQLIDPALADAVFVPESYEPNYAYPLIIWLTDTATRQYELCRVMPQISTRNYFGVSLPCVQESVHEWDISNSNSETAFDALPLPGLDPLERRLFDTVAKMRSSYHIHTERIYLAGFDGAATAALKIGLSHPEWFAGVAAISGEMPRTPLLLSRLPELRRMRVFLGAGSNDSRSLTDLRRAGRLLHTAGLRVCSRMYDAGREVIRPMLQEIDRWVMQDICQPQPVSA